MVFLKFKLNDTNDGIDGKFLVFLLKQFAITFKFNLTFVLKKLIGCKFCWRNQTTIIKHTKPQNKILLVCNEDGTVTRTDT